MVKKIDLERVREELTRLEDNIIISLFNRIQFRLNKKIYIPGRIEIPNYKGSFLDFLFSGTEKLHASAGRYLDQEEHPFYSDTPTDTIIQRKVEDIGLKRTVNLNPKIKKLYLEALPLICQSGDDNKYGSAAIADINCLQNISRRVHIGEQVAEAKFQEDPEGYIKFIRTEDREAILRKLTNTNVEKMILSRVKEKGERYNINPKFIWKFYKEKIIPLTKEVEVRYLIKRIDDK